MTKRYTIGDNIAIVDNESLTPNGIPKNIFVAQDPVEAIKICKELNKQDQQIKELEEEIAIQKYAKHIMRDNIKDYERAIKRLRKSFEKFDEMRLKRIRFLEKRLKKNGLSIYVNDCYDLED